MKGFKESLKEKARAFNKWLESEEEWEVYSHLDADGISSATIMINYLKNNCKLFNVRIVQQLTEEVAKELNKGKKPLILLDFGSGQQTMIKECLKNRKVLILDHHLPENEIINSELIHVNPCLHGEGESDISASGVTCLFLMAAGMNDELMSSISLIGAIGDGQSLDKGLNNELLKQSIITERKDLKAYGHNLRPVHKLLEYSTELEVPGVTGDETKTVMFLQGLGIELMDESGEWRTLSDLTSDEKQRLISGIIIKRKGLDKPEDVFRTVYELRIGELKKTLEEWSSILNACGRMGRPSAAIQMMFNEDDSEAMNVLKDYRKELGKALNWIYNNKDKALITDNSVFIKAESEIPFELIGTICSIASQNNIYDKDVIIGLADKNDEEVKISVRSLRHESLNVGLTIREAVKGFGQGGGHVKVGGATIKKQYQEEFIKRFSNILAERLLKG